MRSLVFFVALSTWAFCAERAFAQVITVKAVEGTSSGTCALSGKVDKKKCPNAIMGKAFVWKDKLKKSAVGAPFTINCDGTYSVNVGQSSGNPGDVCNVLVEVTDGDTYAAATTSKTKT